MEPTTNAPRSPITTAASSSASSRAASAGSVFRSRPGSDLLRRTKPNPAAAAGDEDDDDDATSPQKILLALQTPTHSFDDQKKSSSLRRGDDDNTNDDDGNSPQDPPQLRNAADAATNIFFDPQKSPKHSGGPTPGPTNSLDMAPSFSLFNQSFDSLGDTAQFFNVGGPLDSALQSTSFGGGASILEDRTVGAELQLTASNGTFKLNPSSSGGAFTFGMSPTNSFGDRPSASFSNTRGGGNITLLGNDHRAASPSQVLEFHKNSMDEGLRLCGSMGSPLHSRQYVGGGDAPPAPQPPPPQPTHGHYAHHPSSGPYGHPYHHHQQPYPTHRPYRGSAPPNPDGTPHFYSFLRTHKDAFRNVTFLLPGLKTVLLEARGGNNDENDETPKRQTRDRRSYAEPTQQETAIAQRRVASAVCAFGGTFIGSRMNNDTTNNSNNDSTKAKSSTQSIFREKTGDSATITPVKSETSAPKVSRQRAKYDDALPGRYYENDNRLSWEFEEDPPIGDFSKDDDDDEYDCFGNRRTKSGESNKGGSGSNKKFKNDDDEDDDSGDENEDGTKKKGGKSDQPKMKYRCKLCGQPKQNHTCPYQQSLARSIGTMVYPAVNAFTSAEPGVLAPALSEMNNFIGSGADSVGSAEGSPSRPTPDRMRRINALGGAAGSASAQVTPESLRGTPRPGTSPAVFSTPQRPRGPGSVTSSRRSVGSSSVPSSSRKKRSHAQMGCPSEVGDQADLLFVESMDLKPEQFRMVTSSKAISHPDAFTYPALPLPYAQRKRLSDNLFSLSKEVPQLTDECAAVLREARERDLWDLGVAELMTQVVVVVHCHDGDMCFEGLRRYLLTLGISC